MRNGVAPTQPSSCAASLQARLCADDDVERLIREQPRDRQGALRDDAPAVHDDDAAADLGETLRGDGHVVVARPDDDEVVGVVGDRRGERAPPKPGARDQPHADPPGAEVPLGHRELDEVALGIGHDVAVDDRRLALERLGDDLVGDEADRASGAAVPRDREVRRGDRLEADGVAHPLGHLGGRHVVDADGRA